MILPALHAHRSTRRRGGTPSRRDHEMVREIRERAASWRHSTARELRLRADALRDAVQSGQSPTSDDTLLEGFALVDEAVRRTLRVALFDVQFLAGLALAHAAVAEMQTGEGKTLAAALPAVAHALTGRGVHIATANRYLAGRDYDQLRPVYELLGLTSGLLSENASVDEKRSAYACDITYGPGYEFGFDYLRDQVTLRSTSPPLLGETFRRRLRGERPNRPLTVQRGLPFAVIDEVDHVLIDDASSPLILSDRIPSQAADAAAHVAALETIARLHAAQDYRVDAASSLVELTEASERRIYAEKESIPFDVLLRPWSEYVVQALRARECFRRNVHYVVEAGAVRIVEESTGRIFAQRTWRDGLHQAIEAKERVTITAEHQPLARITRQRFFRLYDGLCGMTGTATGSEREFWKFYRLPVVAIPLRTPSQRRMFRARHFATSDAKWLAIEQDVARIHRTGQPVLVGTRTIANSEALAERLKSRNIPHQLLNGKQDAQEATIIAQAGQVGAITIATNMAGRGTDIRLAPESVARGGLHVISVERHEARRIDRQLIGRSARQGDPGSAQFFVSAEDDLILRHGPGLNRLMRRSADRDGEISEDLTWPTNRLQRRVERLQFRSRCELFRYDSYREDVMARLTDDG